MRTRTIAYWAFVAFLFYAGLFVRGGIFTMPFLLLGAVLAAVAPYRGRRDLFWPPIVGFFGLVLGFVMIAPITGCSSSSSVEIVDGGTPDERLIERDEPTVCRSAIGIRYSSSEDDYNPSFAPGWIGGIATGIAFAFATRWTVRSLGQTSRGRWMYVLNGPFTERSKQDAAVWRAHDEFVQWLEDRGILLLVGAKSRSLVFEAADRDAARLIMEQDPAISSGLAVGTLSRARFHLPAALYQVDPPRRSPKA